MVGWKRTGREMRYYMDFYTHNPSEYINPLNTSLIKALNVKIDQSVSIADPERERSHLRPALCNVR